MATKLYMEYGGLGPPYNEYPPAAVVIIPMPYEATTSYVTGTRQGPSAIIHASRHLEHYDEELDAEPYRIGIHTLPETDVSKRSAEAAMQEIEDIVTGVLQDGKFPLMLGGEHTITSGAVRAFHKRGALSVLQFDAHTDLRDTYDDTPHSHASVMRRVIDMATLVQVGIRSMSREERAFVRQRGQERNIFWGRNGITPAIIDEIVDRLEGPVYITIDLDGLDPSEMPSVGTPEPGGLRWAEMLAVIREVAARRQVVGADVVELCPRGGFHAPDFLAARLVYKLIGYVFQEKIRALPPG